MNTVRADAELLRLAPLWFSQSHKNILFRQRKTWQEDFSMLLRSYNFVAIGQAICGLAGEEDFSHAPLAFRCRSC